MKACFLIAECRLFYVKNSASERNENLLSYCLSQSVFYKNNAFSSIRISHNEFFFIKFAVKEDLSDRNAEGQDNQSNLRSVVRALCDCLRAGYAPCERHRALAA